MHSEKLREQADKSQKITKFFTVKKGMEEQLDDMEWEDAPSLSVYQLERLESSRMRAMRLRRAGHLRMELKRKLSLMCKPDLSEDGVESRKRKRTKNHLFSRRQEKLLRGGEHRVVYENEPGCGNHMNRTSCATPYIKTEQIKEKSEKSETSWEMEITLESGQCEVMVVDDDDELDVGGDRRHFSSVIKLGTLREVIEIRSNPAYPSDRTSCRAYLPN